MGGTLYEASCVFTGQNLCRLTEQQRGVGCVNQALCIRFLYPLQQDGGCLFAQFAGVYVNGAEWRIGVRGVHDVVETHQREIGTCTKPFFTQGRECTKGHHIVVADSRFDPGFSRRSAFIAS